MSAMKNPAEMGGQLIVPDTCLWKQPMKSLKILMRYKKDRQIHFATWLAEQP